MTTNKEKIKISVLAKRALTIAILCIAIIVSLTSCEQTGGSEEILSKEALIQNVNKQTDAKYDCAAEYFDLWQIPEFNMTKIKTVEKRFYDKSVLPLPSVKELAKETALYFLDQYYEGEKAIDPTDSEAVTDALLYCLVYKTGDDYAFYRSVEETNSFDEDMSGEFCGIGISVQKNTDGSCLIVKVYDGSGAEEAGLCAGDVLIAVNGVAFTPENQDDTIDSIKGTEGTSVEVTVKRGEAQMNFRVVRSRIQLPTVDYKILGSGDEKIGYIVISSFKENTDEQFIAAIKELEAAGCRGLMFDLRSNTGGYLDSVTNMIDYLIPDRSKIVSYKQKNYPEEVIYSKTTHKLEVPSVVLCNKYTASAAELFCAAMRDYNKDYAFTSILVGETTYGKGVMQNSYDLRDGSSITLTMAYYNPPCGVNYNGIGVVPDIQVKDDPATAADEQYDAALTELTELVQMKNGTISKELIKTNMSAPGNESYDYISEYLRCWKFPPFNVERLDEIQEIYETNVVELSIESTAKNVANSFFGRLEKISAEDLEKLDLGEEAVMTSLLIDAWIKTTGDEFAHYSTSAGLGSSGVGISYNPSLGTVDIVQKGGAADIAGIMVDDIILEVNEMRYIGNEDKIQNLIKNTSKDLTFKLQRQGVDEPITAVIKREATENQNYKIIEGDLGYIRIPKFKDSSYADFRNAMKYLTSNNVKGIIFDVRGNRGGELTQVVRVIEQFAKLDAPIITIDYFNEAYEDQTIRSTQNGSLGVPVVVLCDRNTASAAELFTAAIRDYAKDGDIVAKIVGSERTFGKGVMQSTRPLNDGASVTYTVADYYPPCGISYSDIGITPDYIVEGSEEQYNKAIEVLRELVASLENQ